MCEVARGRVVDTLVVRLTGEDLRGVVTSLLARLQGSRGRRRILLHVVDDRLLRLDLSRKALALSYAEEMDASHHHGVGDGYGGLADANHGDPVATLVLANVVVGGELPG